MFFSCFTQKLKEYVGGLLGGWGRGAKGMLPSPLKSLGGGGGGSSYASVKGGIVTLLLFRVSIVFLQILHLLRRELKKTVSYLS